MPFHAPVQDFTAHNLEHSKCRVTAVGMAGVQPFHNHLDTFSFCPYEIPFVSGPIKVQKAFLLSSPLKGSDCSDCSRQLEKTWPENVAPWAHRSNRTKLRR